MKSRAMSQIIPSGMTFSGDNGYWKSLYNFKAGAVTI